MNVLITGGTGYIGSHVAVEMIQAGFNCFITDNLYNSKESTLDKIKSITGVRPVFFNVDLRDENKVNDIFEKTKIDAVVHMAGLKAVGESVKDPLLYYNDNLTITFNIIRAMVRYNCFDIVFSSSATVYGQPDFSPVPEDAPLRPANPYGRTKLFIEHIFRDSAAAYGLRVAILRYFNPIGAHPSGLIGEDPSDIPNNLAPYVLKVITGKLPKLNVFGNDYNTHDGTGVRDYIHVCDLANGHLLALKKFSSTEKGEVLTYNLGTGKGASVLEVVEAFSKAANMKVPYVFAPRREGDVDLYYADASKAKTELGFECKYTLDDMAQHGVKYAFNCEKEV